MLVNLLSFRAVSSLEFIQIPALIEMCLHLRSIGSSIFFLTYSLLLLCCNVNNKRISSSQRERAIVFGFYFTFLSHGIVSSDLTFKTLGSTNSLGNVFPYVAFSVTQHLSHGGSREGQFC